MQKVTIVRELGDIEKTLTGLRFEVLHTLMTPEEWKDIRNGVGSIERQVVEIERTSDHALRGLAMAASSR